MLLQHPPFVPEEGVELSEIASLNHQVSASFFRINYTRAIISRHPYSSSPLCCIYIYFFFFFILYFHTSPERGSLLLPRPIQPGENAFPRLEGGGGVAVNGWTAAMDWMAFRRFTRRQLLLPRFGSFPEHPHDFTWEIIPSHSRIDRGSIEKTAIFRRLKAERCNCRFLRRSIAADSSPLPSENCAYIGSTFG